MYTHRRTRASFQKDITYLYLACAAAFMDVHCTFIQSCHAAAAASGQDAPVMCQKAATAAVAAAAAVAVEKRRHRYAFAVRRVCVCLF